MLLSTEPTYPDAPVPNTFRDGIEYQDFVCSELARHHLILQNLSSKKYQQQVGENLQGFEIKLDRRFRTSGRLSIEVAEKVRRENQWTPSGCFRDDNSFLYIQGDYETIFIFAKNWLRRKAATQKFEEFNGTVRKFYISLDEARLTAIKTIDIQPKGNQ